MTSDAQAAFDAATDISGGLRLGEQLGWFHVDGDYIRKGPRPAPPSLGCTKREIYQGWEMAAPRHAGLRVVVGIVPGLGVFSWKGGQLWRDQRPRGQMATTTLATNEELAQIDYAIQTGALQIEARPIYGIVGGQGGQGTSAEAEFSMIVLHRATGRALSQ